jgi:hypothetical protein
MRKLTNEISEFHRASKLGHEGFVIPFELLSRTIIFFITEKLFKISLGQTPITDLLLVRTLIFG